MTIVLCLQAAELATRAVSVDLLLQMHRWGIAAGIHDLQIAELSCHPHACENKEFSHYRRTQCSRHTLHPLT